MGPKNRWTVGTEVSLVAPPLACSLPALRRRQRCRCQTAGATGRSPKDDERRIPELAVGTTAKVQKPGVMEG